MQKRSDKGKTESIKAAFFDIDGTLAAVKTHAIPESTRKALKMLEEKGIQRILSTGRHPLEVEEENILPGLAFDGALYRPGGGRNRFRGC